MPLDSKIIKKRTPISFLLIFSTLILVSQTLEKPILQFSYVCASNSFNNFEIEIAYNTAAFNNNNVFSVELSNKDGDFSLPTVLQTISNQNSSYKFKTNVQFPKKLYGKGYKIRIKSSSPEKISPSSNAFEAYYLTSDRLILNNFTDVILCDGATKEIALNIQSAASYQWYKDGKKIGLGGPKLEVSEPGLYYTEIYYGSCYNAVISNMVEVTKLPKVVSKLKGSSKVEICSTASYVLEMTVDNPNYKYRWYKNGVRIQPAPDYKPSLTVSGNDSFGKYYVEIENENGCVGTSQEVEITEVSSNLTVDAIGDTSTYILKGETKTLKIEHSATNATVVWYKNGIEIPNSNKNQINIIDSGVYYAKVIGNGGSCSTSKNSSEFTVHKIVKFIPKITYKSTYNSCNSEKTSLKLETLKAFDSESNEYNVLENQYQYVKFQWKKRDVNLNGFTNAEISIDTFEKNGEYSLEVSSNAVNNVSNKVPVLLKTPEITIVSSSTSNKICDAKSITLGTSNNNNFTYKWLKDNLVVSNATDAEITINKPGAYQLVATGFGCSTTSNTIIITSFDASSVQLDTPLDIILGSGETKKINASGGDSYIWLDENKNVLGTGSSLEINTKGVYVLEASVNGCKVIKTISVFTNQATNIPNALTLNGDGLNDVWVLPSKYAFNKNVYVKIYNSRGKLVLETNNYQNNWPNKTLIDKNQLFFYVIKNKNKTIKKGTISVIK
ncbi:gliding motility-associated C-terminal domain-containing protein [Polaribacter cellanae]|uniref:Gliding motility-associated C-terminal domain-containing protein n=1 Tax=Polaribacter cellanae TaxID=2818493 RepID=A0A975CLM7_9FLAO|nr:gliding motility-associated C-terminal domain-containing protein [Polaribacter cellanae]QTE21490.1 gliding motility-associated C-terminal domain-containing protein [Polaribacter cellanae]